MSLPRPFIDPDYSPQETSAKLAFAGGRLDRLSEIREETCVADALAKPDTQLLGFASGRMLLRFNGHEVQGLFGVEDLEPFAPQLEQAIMLGSQNGIDHLAVPLAIKPEEEGFQLPEPFKAIDYRSIARQQLLSHEGLGNVAYGGAMVAWHATNMFCGNCGGSTQIGAGGAKRACGSCGKEHFPRTDPVVIMLTTNGDRCLLGRARHFLPGVYSALAGFVEPGETVESAVRRETFEESGIRVGRVTYHASQPWPFPHTLMLGCYGEALESEIVKDEIELEDCRWFTRTEVRTILAGDGPRNADGSPQIAMPQRLAIANRLITDWANRD